MPDITQAHIDRVVQITRVDVPKLNHDIKVIKKQIEQLRIERENLEKMFISRTNKDQEIMVWESSNGVLVEARDREKSVTLLDKVAADG